MVTAQMVKELRERTGAGMMDCKKALTETEGDMEKAIDFLREKGLAKATKKSGRIAAEGIIESYVTEDQKAGVLVEINCETDFVAKNEDFRSFASDVAKQALNSNAADIDAFMNEAWQGDAGKTVKDVQTEKIAVIGENINVRRFEKVNAADGCVANYIHGGGKIGVMIQAKTEVVNDAVKTCLRNVAMQVAAMDPKYVSRDEVPADYLEHEKEILMAQAKEENPNKPENIIEKMITGRLNKELKEICLLDQAYVQDGDLTVAQYLEKVSKEVGATITVVKSIRFKTGEGLEKKVDDFAGEVANMFKKD
ncbi:MAG TPA: translation elongation factor Ts [Firmicutes bacterium]|nr:translation elongation factor Ts [Bacillota bacterium]